MQPMKTLEQLTFDNTYARLPAGFHARVKPMPLEGVHLVSVSERAAALLDLDPQHIRVNGAVAQISGAAEWPGTEPVAMCYAGHQFGNYVPRLGDGRAMVLGEVVNDAGGHWELQLKGAGLTPFSRDGDGRAVLRSTIREYLCSEAMHGLGIPTTRALCMFNSTEEVYRERIESGALLVRMAPSHVRFGSFEVFFYRQQYAALKQLADYVIDHDYPQLRDTPQPYLALLQEVVERTARLMAQWQLVGFAHGVMNTDNMSILGLTLDYGPFGFLDAYDPGFICNHSDYRGRYAFDQQPSIGLWNLTCLAQAMLPLFDEDNGEAAVEMAKSALAAYEPSIARHYAGGLRAKLGFDEQHDDDQKLAIRLLDLMAGSGVDYTNLFRELSNLKRDEPEFDSALRDRFIDREAFDAWARDYRARLTMEASDEGARKQRMDAANPRYILRNYLAQQAIAQAEQGDYAEVDRLLTLLATPYDEQPDMAAYAAEPPDWGRHLEVSCSS